MNNPIQISPLDQLLYGFLSSVDEASGNLNKIKHLGWMKAYRSGPGYLPMPPLSEQHLKQVHDSLTKDGYLEDIRSPPIASTMNSRHSGSDDLTKEEKIESGEPFEKTYRLTAFGKETLRLLSYRMNEAKTQQAIKNKHGFIPVEMKQLEDIFRANEIVLLPLSNSSSINNANPSSCYKLLFCPNFYDRDSIAEITVPRMNPQYPNLLKSDPEYDIFIAFAIMLTLKGVEVFIPADNKKQPISDPAVYQDDEDIAVNHYPLVLENFNPFFQPIEIPMIHESDIEPLLVKDWQ